MNTQAPRPSIERGLGPAGMRESLTPDNLLAGENVTMNFPKTVKLQLDDGGGTVTFFPGVQPVPVALANHWWLKHNGVVAYDAKTAKKPSAGDPSIQAKLPDMTEREMKFLQSRGYQANSVQDTQLFFERMEPLARDGFMKACDLWWDEQGKSQEPEKPVEQPTALPDLSKMTKAELAEHADDAHGVELDPAKMNRDEMIAEIEKLRKEK